MVDLKFAVQFPARAIWLFFPVPRPAVGPTQFPVEGYLRLFVRMLNGRSMRLTTHFRLLPASRMSGAIPLLPHMSPLCAQRHDYTYCTVTLKNTEAV